MATTTILNDLIDLNQTGNTTALKGCVGTNVQQPATPTISVQYLVVGGGGTANGSGSGGGGAGGLSTGTIAVPNNTAVNIVVGQGAAAPTTWDGVIYNGEDSGFYQIQGQGGGSATERADGNPGGSGAGGGHMPNSTTIYDGGIGISGQGNNGGDATSAGNWNTGGGGGAGSVGADGTASQSGNGGSGKDAVGSPISIITQANGITANVGEVNGAELNFAGGGGGGGNDANNILPGNGGSGGGGNGSDTTSVNGFNGTPNTGGGGGGGNGDSATPGGAGGSGVVILKYASTATETIAGSLAGGITTGTTADCDYPTTGTALYQLNDNTNDTCGGNNAIATNITYTTGNFGNAAVFSGSSSYITTPVDFSTFTDYSVSMWIYPTANNKFFAGTTDGSALNGFYLSINSSDQIRFYERNGSTTSSSLTSSNTISLNTWNFITAVRDGSTNYIYVNGIVTSLANSTITQSNDFTFGRTGLYTANPYTGNIDQVRIFPSALTADQIAMLYAENVGATKFDDGTNTTLVFKAGSGTINLTDTSVPGPKIGDLRTNTDQSSANSASAMEHYMSTGWRVFNNCTTSACNYPTTASALYQLNDNANDTCGNSNGTFTNPSYVTGKFGNAASFNGSNNYIEVPLADTPSLLVSTVTFWVKTTTTSADGIIGVGLSSSGYWQSFQAYCYGGGLGGALVVRYGNGTAEGPAISSTSSIDTGEWVFCAVTMSGSTVGSTIKLYVNGVLETTHTTTVSRTDSTSKGLVMGAYYAGNTSQFQNWFTGTVDQARIFPSVLTASQITELYNETSC